MHLLGRYVSSPSLIDVGSHISFNLNLLPTCKKSVSIVAWGSPRGNHIILVFQMERLGLILKLLLKSTKVAYKFDRVVIDVQILFIIF